MVDETLLRQIADDLSTFLAVAAEIPGYDSPEKQAADHLDQLTDALGMPRYKYRHDHRTPNQGKDATC
jgi:hypothetical protein